MKARKAPTASTRRKTRSPTSATNRASPILSKASSSSSPRNTATHRKCCSWLPWALVWMVAIAICLLAYGKVYSNLQFGTNGNEEEALRQTYRNKNTPSQREQKQHPPAEESVVRRDFEQAQKDVATTTAQKEPVEPHGEGTRKSLPGSHNTKDPVIAVETKVTSQEVHQKQPQEMAATIDQASATTNNNNNNNNNPSCFPYNSPQWLQGPRHGNIQEELVTDDFVAHMILGLGDSNDTTMAGDDDKDDTNQYVHTALQQSLCFDHSRFRNATDNQDDERSIHLWMVRMTYLAMHRVQHQFAQSEARVRLNMNRRGECRQQAQHLQIGPMDYECPDAKYFLVAIENLGLGAVIRTTVVSGLLAALATNRTVLFVNHAPSRDTNGTDTEIFPQPLPIIQQDWYHASCERKDVQCFFQPPSPCVLTYDQLAQAPALNNSRQVANFFKNPARAITMEPFVSERAIVLPVRTVTRSVPPNIPGVLRDFTRHYAHRNPVLRHALEQVADRFADDAQKDKVRQLIGYGLVLYALRPNLASAKRLNQVLEKIIPVESFQPEVTLGLPVRASDKCVEESECLTFEQYMQVLTQIWNRNKEQLTQQIKKSPVEALNIILTTESESVIREKDAFMANETLRNNVPFPFRFITNDYDIKQDNGNPENNLEDAIDPHGLSHTAKPVDADEVMLSMLSSLKAQLVARYSIGNCCSNFHRILFEMLDGGCGAAYHSGPECLQTNENPEFRICCIWDNSDECKAKGVGERLQDNIKKVKQRKMQQRRKKKELAQMPPPEQMG